MEDESLYSCGEIRFHRFRLRRTGERKSGSRKSENKSRAGILYADLFGLDRGGRWVGLVRAGVSTSVPLLTPRMTQIHITLVSSTRQADFVGSGASRPGPGESEHFFDLSPANLRRGEDFDKEKCSGGKT